MLLLPVHKYIFIINIDLHVVVNVLNISMYLLVNSFQETIAGRGEYWTVLFIKQHTVLFCIVSV